MEKTVRERLCENEHRILSSNACFSDSSKGRKVFEPETELRTCFQHDRDRVIHCNSFRRLKHKTQVFLSPQGDYYRTRLTHTLEVAQIARTIAVCLGLNETLTEAIALGHDLGHTPFVSVHLTAFATAVSVTMSRASEWLKSLKKRAKV